MNIADVIGWKFNYQAGMRCREIDGVMTIVKFPGELPTQAEQDAWTAEYIAAMTALTRAEEIKSRLAEIDGESIRSIRAITAGRGTPQDNVTLAMLEDEAEDLRVELAGL